MKPSFDHTVSILVRAYLNDTLEHGNYCACAVGNLIAHEVGAEIVLKNNPLSVSKYKWIHPKYEGGEWFCGTDKRMEQIKTTGYDLGEIFKIERAFEAQGPKYNYGTEDQLMFNGLMAVVDVLAEIHGIDLEAKESAKLQFVKTV